MVVGVVVEVIGVVVEVVGFVVEVVGVDPVISVTPVEQVVEDVVVEGTVGEIDGVDGVDDSKEGVVAEVLVIGTHLSSVTQAPPIRL